MLLREKKTLKSAAYVGVDFNIAPSAEQRAVQLICCVTQQNQMCVNSSWATLAALE